MISTLISRGYDVLRQPPCRIYSGFPDEVFWFEINGPFKAGVLTVGKDSKDVSIKLKSFKQAKGGFERIIKAMAVP
jgi:hypothetical protein